MNRLLGFAGVIAMLGAQGTSPGEVQVRTSPYIPPSQYTLKVETKLVEIGVVVRDSHGHTVAGLTKDDFEVKDSGKARAISAFSVRTASTPQEAESPRAKAGVPPVAPKAPPRFLGMLFDNLNTGPAQLYQAKSAAKAFLKQGLAPNDLVSIFTTAHGQDLAFTNDVEKLNQAIDHLPLQQRVAGQTACPTLSAYDGYVIANRQDPTLLDRKVGEAMRCGACRPSGVNAVGSCTMSVQGMANQIWSQVRATSRATLFSLKDIVRYMTTLPGDRVLLLASAGFLSGTLESDQETIIRGALRGGLVINALDAKGLYTADYLDGATAGKPDVHAIEMGGLAQESANDPLATLSYSTGGSFFHNSNDLKSGFRELAAQPEVSYTMGITPDEFDGKYHTLQVRMRRSGYEVQARHGYFATETPATSSARAFDSPAPEPATERKIDTEVVSNSVVNDAPIRFVVGPADSGLQVVLAADVQRLTFREQDGVKHQKITYIAALFDGDRFVTGTEATMELALKLGTLDGLSKGLQFRMTLLAAPGKYRFRLVAQDEVESKLMASSQPVEIK